MFCTLLVDDSGNFRSTVRGILYQSFPGMLVEEAENGSQALQKADLFEPEMVFMDIKLPGENGVSLTRKLKKGHADTVVVMLTAYDIPEYRQAAFRNGADCFIAKGSPSCMEDVIARVEGTLSAKGIVPT